MELQSRRSFLAFLSAFMLDFRKALGSPFALSKAAKPGAVVLENIALHRAAYQSGSVDDDHTAHLATDGSFETYWESKAGQDAWITVDLTEPTSFRQVTLRWGASYATGFSLQCSDDGLHPKNWTSFFSVTDAKGGLQTIPFPAIEARHVRVLVTACSQPDRGCILHEIEVEGARKSRVSPPAQPDTRADGSLFLTGGNWKLQSTMFVQATPDQIARLGFDDSQWIPAMVPGTVLGSYLAIGAIPDPWYGDQMSQLSDDFFSRHDFWYRDSFLVPSNYAGKRLWLNFEGINWKADIFLNGKSVGDIGGAFLRGRFDVTDTLRPGQRNCIAILIHRVAHPEPGATKLTHKKLRMRTTNGDILGCDSPTFLASAGWNWIPIVRGRNIGIWNDVWLDASGDVAIVDPWVTTVLPDHGRADLTVRMELRNHSSTSQTGKIVGAIGDLAFEQEVTLAPEETRTIALDKSSCPALSLVHPLLWWPNGYGDQPLYQLDLSFESAGKLSEKKSVHFGIRDLQCRVIENVLTIFVNGTRILCRGGSWGMAEGMLNCDAAGLDLRVRLHRDANLNMIRNWVGMEGHQAFYESCDRYGILIWDDFWLANPNDGPEPTDREMFMLNVRDKIRRVRSHPALAFYCGRNEGLPPAELDASMRSAVDSLDGTRHYIPHSAAGSVTGLGPYDVKNVEWYFANRGKTLHSEQGVIAIPTVESMRAMMPAEALWPINDMWAVHDYQEPRSRLYTEKIAQRYGKPSGVEDYCRKAQLLNLESAKAMFECLQANQGSGLLLWMTQAAWPSLICQLYDHYFEMTGTYFGAKAGCEPVHILWDSNADVIKAANNKSAERSGLTAEGRSYDLAGREVWHKSVDLDLPATSSRDCFSFTRPVDSSDVFFLHLSLRQGEETLSENFYWGCAKDGSCADLNRLPQVKLQVAARQLLNKDIRRLTVSVTNPTESVALAIRLKVQRAESGERVLPVFYSDNYFSLLPGLARTLSVEFSERDLAGEMPKLIAEGWNSSAEEVTIV